MFSRKKLEQDLLDRTEQVYKQADAVCGRTFVRPGVDFDLAGAFAGLAFEGFGHLSFNLEIYAANQNEFLHEIVPHEVAHLLVFDLYGRVVKGGRMQRHGREWKSVMRLLKAPTNRLHDLLVPGYFVTSCSCRRRVQLSQKQVGVLKRCAKCLGPFAEPKKIERPKISA